MVRISRQNNNAERTARLRRDGVRPDRPGGRRRRTARDRRPVGGLRVGLRVGPSEAEIFRTDFPRSLKSRGLQGREAGDLGRARGPRPLRGSVERNACCRDSEMRGCVAPFAGAWIETASEPARWRATPRDESAADARADMGFPAQGRAKRRSANPLAPLAKEARRRADVLGVFPHRGRQRPSDPHRPPRAERRRAEPAPLHAARSLRPDRRR